MANSVDPDEVAHNELSGSTLFAYVSILVCQAETVKGYKFKYTRLNLS